MNGRLWACVLTGVLVAHLALIYIIHHIRASDRPLPRRTEPNFESRTVTFVDAQGRKVKESSEFTVTTKLADEAMVRQPPAPDAATAR